MREKLAEEGETRFFFLPAIYSAQTNHNDSRAVFDRWPVFEFLTVT